VDIEVQPINDQLIEGVESVTLTIVPAGNYSVGTPASATANIVDDDGPVTIVLEVIDSSTTEGMDSAQFAVRRVGQTESPINVYLQYSGTALYGIDYAALPEYVEIPGGGNQQVVMVEVVGLVDTQVEANESLHVAVKPDAWYTVGGGPITLTVVDRSQITVGVHVIDDVAIEGDISNPAVFRVWRQGEGDGVVADDLVVRLAWSGTASLGVDYEVMDPIEVVIPAGEYSVDIEVQPTNDQLIEGVESVTLTIVPAGNYSVGTPASATANIVDDDGQVTVLLDVIDQTTTEGRDTALFRVRRVGQTESPIIVYLQYSGTALYGVDYDALPRMIEVPGGGATQEVLVEVFGLVDEIVEGNESITVTVAPDAWYSIGGSPVTLTIADQSTVVVGIQAIDNIAGEGEEPNVAVLRVWRQGFMNDEPLNVYVAWSGTATYGLDYDVDIEESNCIVIPANMWFVDVVIEAEEDEIVEGSESIRCTITNSGAYSISVDAAFAEVTLVDNDGPVTVTIERVDAYAYEGFDNPAMFRVRRIGATDATIRVPLAYSGTASRGEDYDVEPDEIEIPGGGTVGEVLVVVTAVDDDIVEGNESILVTILNDQISNTYAIGNSSIDLTIVDNDTNVVLSLRAIDGALSESGPYNVARFRIVRSGRTDRTILARLTYSGTAQRGLDYSELSAPTTVVIPGGDAEQIVEVVLRARDDRIAEGDETIVVQLVQGPGGFNLGYTIAAPDTITIALVDDDLTQAVSLHVVQGALSEDLPGQTAVVRVARTYPSALPLTVSLLYGGTAVMGLDYSPMPSSVTIPAGQGTFDLVFVAIDDDVPEGQEVITVSVQPSTNYQVAAPGTAQVTIADSGSEQLTGSMQVKSDEVGCGTGAGLAVLLSAFFALRLRRRQ
ncbi:MAG: Calx-beta domain-containing protein, partial [Planctomycetota bacterium]|nr:Calx-beta domain-containing protein [Planctomycetota bacterium]